MKKELTIEREVAAVLHVRTGTVGRMETIGIKKASTAQKYVPAFPGCTWQDLMEDPKPEAAK